MHLTARQKISDSDDYYMCISSMTLDSTGGKGGPLPHLASGDHSGMDILFTPPVRQD